MATNMTITCTCGKRVEVLPRETPPTRFYRLADHTIDFRSVELIKLSYDRFKNAVFRTSCPMSGAMLEER